MVIEDHFLTGEERPVSVVASRGAADGHVAQRCSGSEWPAPTAPAARSPAATA